MSPSVKTIADCASCPHLGECDAHITGGTYNHQESGCLPVITSYAMDASTRRFCDSITARGCIEYEYYLHIKQ